jgi:hypothetical protein
MDLLYVISFYLLCHWFHFLLSEGLLKVFVEEIDFGVSFNVGHTESDCRHILSVIRGVNISRYLEIIQHWGSFHIAMIS